MFGIHKKLKAWNKAGLISAEQMGAITAHEKTRHQGRFGRNMIGLALFAIIIGILSLVAANWANIPGSVKIGVHLFVNLALAFAVWRGDRIGHTALREGALLVLGGLTLTLIALIGQVYQLGGSWAGALLVWQLAIMPAFVLYGQTRLTVLPGVLSLVVSMPVILFDLVEIFPEFWQIFYALMLGALMPLCLIADGHVKMFRRLRPEWSLTSQRIGFVLLTLWASFSCMFWYEDRASQFFGSAAEAGLGHAVGYLIYASIFIVALAGLAIHRMLYQRVADDPAFYEKTWLFTLGGVAMMALPVLLPWIASNLVGMMLFILYWLGIAWYAHTTGAARLLSLAIFLVALRVWIIYLEAAGGLMFTGFGLITGGVLMLVMIYGARKINQRLTAKGASHA